MSSSSLSARLRSAAVIALVSALLAGCAILRTKKEVEEARGLAMITGTVVSDDGTEGVLVVLFAVDGNRAEVKGISELSELQDSWGFVVDPESRYLLGAFKDTDGDRRWQPPEPAALVGTDVPIQVPQGSTYLGLVLELADNATPPPGLAIEASLPSVTQSALRFAVGEIVALDDERFSLETASKGLWQPLTSLGTTGAGIYFLEPYDPHRIPVLFVHGIGGTPRDLEVLIETLDRRRFQPWIFHYPSGFRLATIALGLRRQMVSLSEQLDFDTLYVTAHSMGGLVARAFILGLEEEPEHRDMIGLFVTFASPLEGHASAKWGLKFTPEPVPAWIDMEPESDFIEKLKQPLPANVPYYLLFGYKRGGNVFMSASHDSVVHVSSQIPLWAQEQAVLLRGFDLDHMEILSDPKPVEVFTRILDEVSSGS